MWCGEENSALDSFHKLSMNGVMVSQNIRLGAFEKVG